MYLWLDYKSITQDPVMDCKEVNTDTNESGNNALVPVIKRTSPEGSEIHQDSHDNNAGRWTTAEHLKFIEGLQKYGKKWKYMQKQIPTRTSSQIRTHAQKFFIRLRAKLGCNEDQALLFLKAKPAKYFVSDSHKFAKLEYEPACSLAGSLGLPSQSAGASSCPPKILVPTPIRAGSGSKGKMQISSGITQGFSAACNRGLEVNGSKLQVMEKNEEIKEPSPSTRPSSGLATQATSPETLTNPFTLPPITSSISAIVQENLVLNESVRSSYTALTAFSEKLSGVSYIEEKNGVYLQDASERLEGTLRGILGSLAKSNALIQQLLMQIILWNTKSAPQ